MKHLFTLSLVFFSLTHLAQAQRVESVDLSSERVCANQNATIQLVKAYEQTEQLNSGFLTYSDLSLSGTLFQIKTCYPDFTASRLNENVTGRHTKNNSP
ncbi:hypothetical protein [Pedobacter montanisoli]|uniref:Uncharacterized protein n=1 Tax=Pedobacter montanisoli TaxID=2923277 RepID=A0ABS9ZU87_9SPHI|nr:hypothetical protein [Pedobacter montanisoli]MCJ0742166.1 hypothetical protein [Pedobacter montanisoli]